MSANQRSGSKQNGVSAIRNRSRARFLLVLSGVACVVGCNTVETRFTIVDYQSAGQPQRYAETFEEAFYDLDPRGNIDIVLRRETADASLSQVIHIRSFWRSIPGRTVAHDSQINGTVNYAICSGQSGTLLEGAGSVFFEQSKDGNQITGSLELALLEPRRRLPSSLPVFEKVELRGQFTATRDPRRVRRMIHELNRRFDTKD